MNLARDVASLQIDLETIPPAPECLHQRVTCLGAQPAAQPHIVWNPEPWIKWLGDLPQTADYLEDLSDRMAQKHGKPALEREDVLYEVRTQRAGNQIHLAFIAV